ncbi:MAG: hypothetical protein JNN13_18345 [Planctomycetes bacterium]|nr:hypothetical protein [Planctomycetota bacterium]
MTRALSPWLACCLAVAAPAQNPTELERLVRDLGQERGDASYQAYLELSRRRDAAAVPLLAKGITGFPRMGQQYAVYLLQAQPFETTRAVWTKLLDAEAPFLRAAAAAALAKQNERGAVDKLAAVLRDAAENERAGLVFLTYGLDTHDPVFAALLSWLHPGARSNTVVAALQRLATIEGRRDAVRAAVEPLATAADGATRAAALAFLAGFSREHAAALTKLLQAEPERLQAIRYLLDNDHKLPAALLEVIAASLAKATQGYEITQTAALLRRQGSAAGAAHLRELLRHEKAELRAAALEALAQDGGGIDDKDLRALLHGDDVGCVLTAADLLRRRDDPSGLEAVLAAMPKAGTQRLQATEVLARFRDRRAVAPLLDLLDDGDHRVRSAAWFGLQELMRGLFPYRRFDFEKCGYSPESASRQASITTLRAWWDATNKPR